MAADERPRAGSTEFLGRGWAYPVDTAARGRIALSEREADVEASIRIILGTAKGERVMRPSFGCGIHEYVFATVDSTTLNRIRTEVRDALVEWEGRIEVRSVDVSIDDIDAGKLLVRVEYRIRSTNTEFNLVYPFYLEEGRRGE